MQTLQNGVRSEQMCGRARALQLKPVLHLARAWGWHANSWRVGHKPLTVQNAFLGRGSSFSALWANCTVR